MSKLPTGIPKNIQKMIDEHQDSLICDEDDLDYWLGGAQIPFDPSFLPNMKEYDLFNKELGSIYGNINLGLPDLENDQQMKCMRGQHERVDVGFMHSKWVCKHCDTLLIEGKDF